MSTPWTPYPRNVGSFQRPIPLITTEPDDDATRVVVCFSGDYVPVILGALSQLMNQATWIADYDELAAMRQRITRLQEMIAEGECVDGCCPLFRRNPATGLPQVSYDDGATWDYFPEGPYEGADGPPIAPVPPALGKDTSAADRCFAAWDAAAVIAQFYQQSVGQVAAGLFNAVLSINQFLYNLNQALLRLVYPSEAQIAQALGFFNFDWGTYATAPTLDDTAMDALRCLLYDNSTWTDGVVSFNSAAVAAGVVDALGANPGTAVLLLLNYMNQSGLDAAGGVQSVEEADCSECEPCEDFSDSFTTGYDGAHNGGGDYAWASSWLSAWSATGGRSDAGCLINATDQGDGSKWGAVIVDFGKNCAFHGVSWWMADSGNGANFYLLDLYSADQTRVGGRGFTEFPSPSSWNNYTLFTELPAVRYVVIQWIGNPAATPVKLDDLTVSVG